MVAGDTIRLSKLAREFNVGIHTIVDFLHKKGYEIDSNPNTKISAEAVQLLEKEYKVDLSLKKESEKISLKSHRPKKEVITIEDFDDELQDDDEDEEPAPKKVEKQEEITRVQEKPEKPKVLGKIDLDNIGRTKKKKEEEVAPEAEPEKELELEPEIIEETTEPEPEETKIEAVEEETQPEEVDKEEEKLVKTDVPKVEEIKVVGKIDLQNINQKTRPAKKSREEKEKDRRERLKQRNTPAFFGRKERDY